MAYSEDSQDRERMNESRKLALEHAKLAAGGAGGSVDTHLKLAAVYADIYRADAIRQAKG